MKIINPLIQGGRTDYNYHQWYIDDVSELPNLNITGVAVGSVAVIISESAVYMLNQQREWVEV